MSERKCNNSYMSDMINTSDGLIDK